MTPSHASVRYFESVCYKKEIEFNHTNCLKGRPIEDLPGPIDMLECFPMGSSALLFQWKSPAEGNFVLTGYRIYYSKVTGTQLGPEMERLPRIFNNMTVKAKLAGLEPESKYRVTIKATSRAGEGRGYFTECDTNPQARVNPDMPSFKYVSPRCFYKLCLQDYFN